MPFSFTQIEQEKTHAIRFSLAFLLFFYFFSALILVYVTKAFFYFSSLEGQAGPAVWPALDMPTMVWAFGGALVAGLVHWQFSQHGLIDNVLQMMSSRQADPDNNEERVFRNVVEEAAVATGGKYKIEAHIIPTAAMNAFALQDFKGRCVIGVTEGLLRRLNREQLEAVVAHEAGHIAAGDCLETTSASALFKTFDNICDITGRMVFSSGHVGGHAYGRSRRSDGRIVLFFLVIFLLATLLRFIGFLGSMFISRQREYRADAISAKLTRNPMALAEALHIINRRWKGSGMPGENMEAIFISNPRKSSLEESTNIMADLFTTHPPAQKRIAVLLDMAHADQRDLDNALKKAEARFESLYAPSADPGQAKKVQCPRCHVPLTEEDYESVPVLNCRSCEGVLATEQQVLQIVHKRERSFDARIVETGQLLRRQAPILKQHPFDSVYDEKSIVCPSCVEQGKRMHRRFVSPQFPIEVDKCKVCGQVWFDKDELEVLQYLYEFDHPIVT